MMNNRCKAILVAILTSFVLCDGASAYYSPRLGRWLSRDPIEESGGSNLYTFVSNDPIDRLDFTGTWDIDMHDAATFVEAIDAGFGLDCSRAIAAADVDQDTTYQLDLRRHFPSDSGYAAYLADLRTQLNAALNGHPPRCDEATDRLGRLLHSIQDGFSHVDGVSVGTGNREQNHYAATWIDHSFRDGNFLNPHRPDQRDLFAADWDLARQDTRDELRAAFPRFQAVRCCCNRP